jgi:hypothetical protein
LIFLYESFLLTMPYPNRVFGQAMKKQSKDNNKNADDRDAKSAEAANWRRMRQEQGEVIDAKFGYHRLEDQPVDSAKASAPVERRGWLFHMLPTTVRTEIASNLIV